MLDVLLDALIDSAKIFPILLLVYILIEIIEDKSSKSIKRSKQLGGAYAPLIAGGLGIVPQCGFSVIATDLFAKKKIAMGTLLAVFIATSDEAIPIMLSSKKSIIPLLIMLAIKLVFAILVGYIVNIAYNKLKSRNSKFNNISQVAKSGYLFTCETYIPENQSKVEKYSTPVLVNFDDINTPSKCDIGCCGHNIEKDPSTLHKFIIHPLIHSLKIFAFILVVNLVFGFIIYFVGEDALANFMQSTNFFQPFLVCLVGLIPNCASSVVISNLYLLGGINFGSCVAGLCANAGIGLAVLFRQNSSKIENLVILGLLYSLSSLLGFVICFF